MLLVLVMDARGEMNHGIDARKRGIPVYNAERSRSEGWMNLTEAAAFLGISPRTLRLAVERGEIAADHPLADGPWIFNRRILETDAASNLVTRVCRNHRHPAVPISQEETLDFSGT